MLAAIRRPPSPSGEFLRKYTEQMKRLLPEDAGLALLGADGTVWWSSLERPPPVDARVLDWLEATAAPLQLETPGRDVLLAVLPVLHHGELVAALLLRVAQRTAEPAAAPLDRIWRRLRPTLDRLGRQLAWSAAGRSGRCRCANGRASICNRRTSGDEIRLEGGKGSLVSRAL